MSDPLPDLPPAIARLVADVADEFRARQARGEDPDPEEYATRHPEAADAIRRVLKVLKWSSTVRPARFPPLPAVLGGDFRLGREVGRGAVGVVFEAEQVSLGRRVAVKVLQFAALADPRLLQRFEIEGRAAAALDHPHVVRVYEVGSDRGVPFLAMQFVDGRPLSELIQAIHAHDPAAADPRSADFVFRVAALGVQAAEALEHAHASGVVHRDVKPGNLLVDASWNVWVTDFGLAKTPGADVTGTGDVVGTLRYMSPEQALARHNLVDHRADVYGLGATLYELLTGRPAAPGTDKVEVLRQVTDGDPVPVRRLNPAVPRDLETVVHKCLRKDPGERYASARELADDLRRFLTGDPVRARPLGLAARLWRRVARRPALAGLAAAVVCATGLAVGLGLFAAYRGARLDAIDADRRLAEAKLAAVTQREELQRFHAGLERVRQRRADPQTGWTRENLTDLGELSRLGPKPEHLHDLRSEAAAALAGAELVLTGVVAGDFPTHAIDFLEKPYFLAAGGWFADDEKACHVRIYDAASQARLNDLKIPADETSLAWERKVGRPTGVRSVRFSPDGRWLAAGMRDGRLARWDVPGFGDPVVWPAHADAADTLYTSVARLLFAPDGTRILSSTPEVTRGWTLDGEKLFDRSGHELPSDGRLRGSDVPVHPAGINAMRLMNVYDGGLVGDLADGGGTPFALAVDGRLAAYRAPGDDFPRLRSMLPGARPRVLSSPTPIEMKTIEHLAFDRSGARLVTVEETQRRVRIWDVVAGKLSAERLIPGDTTQAAFTPDGRQLAVCGGKGIFWFEASSPVTDTIGVVAESKMIMFAASADQRGLVGIGSEGGQLSRGYHQYPEAQLDAWADVSGFAGLMPVGDHAPGARRFVWSLDASPRGTMVLSAVDGRQWVVGELQDARYGPDNHLWILENHTLSEAIPWDWVPGRVWQNDSEAVEAGQTFWVVAPGRTRVLVGRRDGRVVRFDRGGGETASWPVFENAVSAVSLSADGHLALVGGAGGELCSLDTRTGATRPIADAHSAAVRGVAIGPGFWVTGSADGRVRLWTTAGDPLATIRMHGAVRRMHLSADGKSLLVLVESETGLRRWHLDRLFAEWRRLGLGDGLPET